MSRLTLREFIERACKVHGDRYDYSKVVYVNNKTKVTIICKEHGEFLITPINHIHNIAGCPACGKIKERLNASASILSKKFKGLVQPEDYKLIPLTRGFFAQVDNEDFERLKVINWSFDDRYAYSGEYGYMHRYIMKCPKELVVDHKNHDKLDNRKVNLRVCEHVNNHWNRLSSDKFSSPHKGVVWINSTGKWRASIKINGVNNIIGHFDAESDAGKAFDLKAIELRGEFAYETLNFPELLTEYLKELKEY